MINTVRLALPAEAVDIARIQRRVWSEDPVLKGMLRRVTADEATHIWHQAVTRAKLATMRVLVALGESGVAAFAATQPSTDPDASPTTGQLAEFIVDPAARHQGHGSRLIQAAVDTMRADNFETATMWLPTENDALRSFLTECGWGPDGAHQEVGTEDGQHVVKLVRMATDIRP